MRSSWGGLRAWKALACFLFLTTQAASTWFVGADDSDLVADYSPVPGTTDLDRGPMALPMRAPSLSRHHLPSRWLILCWDGATWDIILPLLSAGAMPNLASLMSQGTYGSLLTIRPTQSPVVWTTVATGVSPARHGIIGFQKGRAAVRRPDPGSPLYDNRDRRAKALWNLLSENGRTVVVSGYHATFPAEPVAGIMISNYTVRRDHSLYYRSPRVDEAGARVRLVHPPAALAEVRRFERQPADLGWEELHRFANVSPEEFRRLMSNAAPDSTSDRWAYLCKAYLYDRFHAENGLHWWKELRPAVGIVHFQSLDWASHHFLYFHWSERFLDRSPHRVLLDRQSSTYRGTVAAFHDYVDEWLGRFLRERDGMTAVMILSDHGTEPQPARMSGTHENAPPGIIVMNGPGVRAGMRLSTATVYDVLPTLLATLGLPLARDLEGRVLSEAFEPGARRRLSPAVLATYGRYRHPYPETDSGAGYSRNLTEELRGLGYIH